MPIAKKLLIFLIIALVLPNNIAFAQNIATSTAEIEYESITPGSPYYVFKRIKETVTLNFLTFGEKNKAKYSAQLLKIRLNELAHSVKNNKIGYLENVANRYTNQAGVIIEKYAMTNNPDIKKQAQGYIPILEKLRDNYPANSPYWLMIQYAVDTTKRLAGS